jgi:hypothetical protein
VIPIVFFFSKYGNFEGFALPFFFVHQVTKFCLKKALTSMGEHM